MANKSVREAAKRAGVYLWQIADALGMNDSAFSRKLRKELLPAEKQAVMETIERLVRENREVV